MAGIYGSDGSIKRAWSYSIVCVFVFIHVLFLGYLVGSRDLALGSDTHNYHNIFHGIVQGYYYSYEPGFYYFTKLFSFFKSSELYFFSIYVFITIFMLLSYRSVCGFSGKSRDLRILAFFSFFGFLFLSNWFFAATHNGLRQGMALSVLYFAAIMLLHSKYLVSIALFLAAAMFHKSVYLFFPFLGLLFVRDLRVHVFVVLLAAAFYYFGVSEMLILFASHYLGLSLYSDIKYYAESLGGNIWAGFDVLFVVYTLFWFFFPLALFRLGIMALTKEVREAQVIYSALSTYYFVYGFGGFSNRYAFFAWLFVPILQAVVFVNVGLNKAVLLFFSFLVFYFGFFYFLSWYFY